MTGPLTVPEVPFPLVPSKPGVWHHDAQAGAVVATAPAHTDLYVDPAGDVAPACNAPVLLGAPPPGDFQFGARVTVGFAARYDAGVLVVWVDEGQWAKLCFERSPAGEPMVVSVVTRGVSDDANAFVVGERSVRLRVSRIGHVHAFHASTDGRQWQLIRLFALGDAPAGHRIGFEAQSPTGEGCVVTFDEIGFSSERLGEPRDGS